MAGLSDANIDRLEKHARKAFRRLIAAVEAAGQSRTEAGACFISQCMNACTTPDANEAMPDALRKAAYIVEDKIATNKAATSDEIKGILESMEAQGLAESKTGPDGEKLWRLTKEGIAQKGKGHQSDAVLKQFLKTADRVPDGELRVRLANGNLSIVSGGNTKETGSALLYGAIHMLCLTDGSDAAARLFEHISIALGERGPVERWFS